MSKTMNNKSNIRKHQPLCSKLIKKKAKLFESRKNKKRKKKASNFVTK